MVDAEVKKGDSGGGGLAVFAGAVFGDKSVGADDVFGTKIAGTHAVAAGKVAWHLVLFDDGQALAVGEAGMDVSLGERGANFTSEWVVAGERFVGALDDDDGFLALEGVDDGGKGRMTLTWTEPTFAPRVSRR